ncbi:hypothetical protein ACF0H5_021669 [Mactra antiquata]
MDIKIIATLMCVICTLHITVSKSLSAEGNDLIVNELTDEIRELKDTVRLLKEEVRSMKQSNETSGVEKQEVAVKLSRSRRATRRHVREVAFQATLTRMYERVKDKEPIKYNQVHTNIGRAFDSRTGIFTAPVRGTYSFSTNIVAEEGNYVEACIQVDNHVKASAISDHRNKLDIWSQGNANAILRLQANDKVYVSIQWPYGEHLIHGVGKTSFSGYLIKATP